MADVRCEAVQQAVHGGVGALLAADVQHNMTVVHHQRAVAQGQRVVHVVGDHQAGQVVFGHDFFGQLQHLVRRAGVQRRRVLVKQQQLEVAQQKQKIDLEKSQLEASQSLKDVEQGLADGAKELETLRAKVRGFVDQFGVD